MTYKIKKLDRLEICAITFMFVMVICLLVVSLFEYYQSDAVGYDQLKLHEYTFVKCEIIAERGNVDIEIYVEEESKPLSGMHYVQKAVNKDVLKHAKKGDKLIVWVSNDASRYSSYSIYEGKINGEYFLRLEDYRKYRARYFIPHIVLSSVLIISGVAGAVYYFFMIAKKK